MGELYVYKICLKAVTKKSLHNFHTGVLNMLTYAYTEKEKKKATLLTLGI